jgi:hypothetical protein
MDKSCKTWERESARRTPVADGALPPALRKRSAVTREGREKRGTAMP